MKKMNEIKVSIVPCSAAPLRFDETKCIGCNTCAQTCHSDVLLPSTEKGVHPIVVWPGECWYCGACIQQCPVPGAIKLEHPLMNRTKFVDVIPEPAEK